MTPNYQAIFYDLDDTLYPPNNGLWDAIGARIDRFMADQMHIPPAQVPELREALYKEYGTTLRGLYLTRQADAPAYLKFVHDVPLAEFIQPNPALRPILLRYPQPRYILTNADHAHAGRVLDRLGVGDCFTDIISIDDFFPACKPMADAFRVALRKARVEDAGRAIFIDDSPRNLRGAAELGFFTLRVGGCDPVEGESACVPSLADLPSVLDALLLEEPCAK